MRNRLVCSLLVAATAFAAHGQVSIEILNMPSRVHGFESVFVLYALYLPGDGMPPGLRIHTHRLRISSASSRRGGFLEAPTAQILGDLDDFLGSVFLRRASRPILHHWAGIMAFSSDSLPDSATPWRGSSGSS